MSSIKENRAKEVAEKKAAEAAKAREEELAAIQPKDIVETMNDIETGKVRVDRDENGRALGVNGGKYIQTKGGTIGAETEEGINTIKERMSRGINGDGLIHKIVHINGMPCDCCGANEQELEEDIRAAENYAKAHPNNMLKDTDVAAQLVDAEFKQDELEQIEVKNKNYFICYNGAYAMDTEGNTICSLDDIPEELSRDSIRTILAERIAAKK